MARPWRIVITGLGPSRNDLPTDADAMAARLCEALREQGHTIKGATVQDDTGKNYPIAAAPVEPAKPAATTAAKSGPQKAAAEKRNPGDGQA